MVRTQSTWPSQQVAPSAASTPRESEREHARDTPRAAQVTGGMLRRSKPPTSSSSSNPNKLLKLLRKISSHNSLADTKPDLPCSPTSRFGSFASLSGSFSDLRKWKKRVGGKRSTASSECSDIDSSWASQPPTPMSARGMPSPNLQEFRSTFLTRNAVNQAGSETGSYTSSCSYSPCVYRLGGSTSGGSAASSEIAVAMDSSFTHPPHPICGVVCAVDDLHQRMRGMLDGLPNSQQHRSALNDLVNGAASEVAKFNDRLAAVENLERRVRQQRLEKHWRFVQTREQLASSVYRTLKLIIKHSFGLQQSDVRTLEMVDVLCQWEEGLKCKSASAEGEPWQLDALDYVLELLNTQNITLLQIEREILAKETSETRAYIADLENMLHNNPRQLLTRCSPGTSSRSSDECSISGKMKKSPSKVRFQDVDEPWPSSGLKNVLMSINPLKLGSQSDDGASGSGSCAPSSPVPSVSSSTFSRPSPVLKSALKGSKSLPVAQTFRLDFPLDPCPALTAVHPSESEPDLHSIRHPKAHPSCQNLPVAGPEKVLSGVGNARVGEVSGDDVSSAGHLSARGEISRRSASVDEISVSTGEISARSASTGENSASSASRTYYSGDSSLSLECSHTPSVVSNGSADETAFPDRDAQPALPANSSFLASEESASGNLTSAELAKQELDTHPGTLPSSPSSTLPAAVDVVHPHAEFDSFYAHPVAKSVDCTQIPDTVSSFEISADASCSAPCYPRQPQCLAIPQMHSLPPTGRQTSVPMELGSSRLSATPPSSSRSSTIPPVGRASPRQSLDTPRSLPPATPPSPGVSASLHHMLHPSPRKGVAGRQHQPALVPSLPSAVKQEEASHHLLNSSRSDLSSCPSARSRDSYYSHMTSQGVPEAAEGSQFLDVWYSNGFYDVPASPGGTLSARSSVAGKSEVASDGPIMVSQHDSVDGSGSGVDSHCTLDSYNRLPMPPMSTFTKPVMG